MHYLLIYELAPDYLQRRAQHRALHLQLAWKAAEGDGLVLGGALAEPADRAMLLVESDSPAAAEAFAKADPYVLHGLVTRWDLRPWTTVVGRLAATPVRG